MLCLAQPTAGQRLPPTGGTGDGSRWSQRRPPRYEGWEARALLAGAGALYFAAAELSPFDRVDAWIDRRLFWEPIGLATLTLLVVLAIGSHRERRRLAGRLAASSTDGAPSELVPICTRCKAVYDEDDIWEPIEAYLAHRTADKFTRSLCPRCLELIGG